MLRVVLPITLIATCALLVVVAALGGRDSPATPTGPRIVALSPALAITLVDLGLEDRIVGRHGWDYVLDKDIPVCGDQSGIDFEALLSVEPTHVLLEWGHQDIPDRLTTLQREHDWTVHDFSMLSLGEVAASIVTLATMFETDPLRPELERAATATTRSMLDRLAPQYDPVYDGRVLLLWPTNPPAAVGPGSFHHEMLVRCGGTPAIASGGPYQELDAESILMMRPDAIAVISPRDVGAPDRRYGNDDIDALLGVVAGLDIPAMNDRRVRVIDDPLVLTPSTAMIDFGRSMRDMLEAWAE